MFNLKYWLKEEFIDVIYEKNFVKIKIVYVYVWRWIV